jgi:hypothetical protein
MITVPDQQCSSNSKATLVKSNEQQYQDPRYHRPPSLEAAAVAAVATTTPAVAVRVARPCKQPCRKRACTQLAAARNVRLSGHTGTAMANLFLCRYLQNVLLEVLSHLEESGVAVLKPVTVCWDRRVFSMRRPFDSTGTHNESNAVIRSHKDELVRKQNVQQGIAHLCYS